MSVYVITSWAQSPVAITYPRIVGYVSTLKEARTFCDEKNKKAMSCHYNYYCAKNLGAKQ